MQEMLPVGAFVPAMDVFFFKPILAFILFIFYCFFSFFCSRANQGTLPWRGDQWWQCYPQVLSQK
jgi:hypothetical protein